MAIQFDLLTRINSVSCVLIIVCTQRISCGVSSRLCGISSRLCWISRGAKSVANHEKVWDFPAKGV
jgi:hypothetical protein